MSHVKNYGSAVLKWTPCVQEAIWTERIPNACSCTWSWRVPSVRPEKKLQWMLKFRDVKCRSRKAGEHG